MQNVVPETGVTIITSMWVPPWDRIMERGWWALAAHGKKSLNLLEQTVSGNVHVKSLPVRAQEEARNVGSSYCHTHISNAECCWK